MTRGPTIPRLTAWGRVAGTTFQGTEQTLALDGDVLTGIVGLDAAQGRWLGGVAVAHSQGTGTYTMPLADGSSLTAGTWSRPSPVSSPTCAMP